MAAARPWWKINGSPLRKRGEVLLGVEAAVVLDKGPGGTVSTRGRLFHVTGVLHPTGEKEDGMIIADIADVQALAKKPGGAGDRERARRAKAGAVEGNGGERGAARAGRGG